MLRNDRAGPAAVGGMGMGMVLPAAIRRARLPPCHSLRSIHKPKHSILSALSL